MQFRPQRAGPPEEPEPDADDAPDPERSESELDEHELKQPPAQSRPAVPPVVVPRWIQLVVLPLSLLGLWALARASGAVLLILIIASVIALILNPLVKLLERVIPRGLAILAVYLLGFGTLGGVGVLLSNPISTQVSHFAKNVPHLVDQANSELASIQRWFDKNGINVHIERQGQTALQTVSRNIVKSSGSIVSFSRDLLGKIVTISFDAVLTLVLSIYLLVYGPQIGQLVRRIMPPGDGTPEDDYPLLVQRAVFGYVRGQILFSLIMGSSAALALWLYGVSGVFPDGSKYTLFFGAFYGLMEFIPYIGPIIGPLPAVLVALFNDPISALWVVILFVALQQLEGHFVAPQVFRISLRINPILIILSLLIGYQLYGIAGSLVALPLAAVIRQTVVYLNRHLVFESWGVATAGSTAGAGVLPFVEERCPDCGAPRRPGDTFCPSCGAPLAAEVSAYRESD